MKQGDLKRKIVKVEEREYKVHNNNNNNNNNCKYQRSFRHSCE